MRQINFLIIFAVCLAFVLFSLQNNQPALIQIIPGVELEAPLSVELMLSMGVGAILAWLFGIWSRLQNQLTIFRSKWEIRSKNKKIENLEEDLRQFQMELEKQPQLMLTGDKLPEEKTTAEVIEQ